MRNLLYVALLSALGSVVHAQEPLTRNHPRLVEGPLQRLTMDLGSGRVTRLGPSRPSGTSATVAVAHGARATANCFLNIHTMGFFSTGTTDTEWRDWATKATGKTGIVDRFYFAYATDADDPDMPPPHQDPGPGGALEVSFYVGETGFCTGGGVEVGRYCFTGLNNLPGRDN